MKRGTDLSSVPRQRDAREPLRLLTLFRALRGELDGFDFEGSTEVEVTQVKDRILEIMEPTVSDLKAKNFYAPFLPWVDEIRSANQRELRLILIGMLRWINASIDKLEPDRGLEFEPLNLDQRN